MTQVSNSAARFLKRLLIEGRRTGIELILPKDPRLVQHDGTWVSADILMDGELHYTGEIPASPSPFPFRMLWLKEECDGEKSYGDHGIGLLHPNLVDPGTLTQLDYWHAQNVGLNDTSRGYSRVSTQELNAQVSEIHDILVPVLKSCGIQCRLGEDRKLLQDLVQALCDPSSSIIVVTCRKRAIASISSNLGVPAMVQNVQMRLEGGDEEAEFVLFIDGLAARMFVKEDEWMIVETRSCGELLNDSVWFRTDRSGSWYTLDPGGFGIVSGRIGVPLQRSLSKRDYAERRHLVSDTPTTDLLAPLAEILKAIAGVRRPRRAKGKPVNFARLQQMYYDLTTKKKEVTLWWLL